MFELRDPKTNVLAMEELADLRMCPNGLVHAARASANCELMIHLE